MHDYSVVLLTYNIRKYLQQFLFWIKLKVIKVVVAYLNFIFLPTPTVWIGKTFAFIIWSLYWRHKFDGLLVCAIFLSRICVTGLPNRIGTPSLVNWVPKTSNWKVYYSLIAQLGIITQWQESYQVKMAQTRCWLNLERQELLTQRCLQ